VAGLAVSNLACFAALMVLYRLTALELGAATAERTVWYLVAFPTAFFLSAAYNASLFVLLVAGCLYAMRRGHWWVAGALGGLASATRAGGVLLVFAFAIEYVRQNGFSPRRLFPHGLAVALIPSGVAAFSLYCWRALGDPLAFSHAQEKWYRTYEWPWISLWRTVQEARKPQLLAEYSVVNFIDLAAALAFLALIVLCFVGPWRLRRDQWYLLGYAIPALLLPLVVPATDERPLISMARHVLDVIPAFMVLGRIGANRWFDRIYPMPAIAFQAILLAIFLHYDWAG
jgi:hypothetical protein